MWELGGPQYWPGTSPSSDSSWSGLVERGSSFGFWPRRNLHSWFLVSWSRDTWAGWKGCHGRLWLPLQGHSLWPGNLSRVGSLHGAPSSAGLPRCGLGPILKAQAFQRLWWDRCLQGLVWNFAFHIKLVNFTRYRSFEVFVIFAMDQATMTWKSQFLLCVIKQQIKYIIAVFNPTQCGPIRRHYILEGSKVTLTNAFSSACAHIF